MRFALLGSGSRGNATLIENRCGATTSRILLDCGFALREAEARLQRLGLDGSAIDGILLTHEHGDHATGAFRFARKYEIPVWMTYGTFAACESFSGERVDSRIIDSHGVFSIGDIEAAAFPVPHDAREPAQFCFSDGSLRLAVLTDLGEPTAHVQEMLSGVDGLVLECNHDRQMLAQSRYHASLKRRIGGRLGHLANDSAGQLLRAIDTSRLQHIVAAHLSAENNRSELARGVLAEALDCSEDWVAVADQDSGLDWRELREK